MRNRNQTGFTLLEVLLAISITAGLGLGANHLLNSMVSASSGTELRSQQIRELQRMDLWIKQDLLQVAGRKVRDIYGDHTAILSTQGDYGFEFTRSGYAQIPHGEFKRSNLQRVAYGLRGHDSEYCESAKVRIEAAPNAVADGQCLVRWFWPVLDQAPDTEPVTQVLLDDIEEARFYFRGQIIDTQEPKNSERSNEWQEEWPPSTLSDNQKADLVQIKLEYTVPALGTIERIYEVPRYAYAE